MYEHWTLMAHTVTLKEIAMSTAYEPQSSPKREAFLASVENGKYDRQIVTGLQILRR